ncbi:MAG TPA: peptidoglycan editing factor PgeF [Patescibacteria group bacterium]
MSEKEDGSMKLIAGTDLNVENRQRFFEKIGIAKNKIVAAEIVHGTGVEFVDKNSPEFIAGVDGLITKSKSLFLSVTVADCIPVFVYEKEAGILGIAHCGWRGIVDGIIESMIKKVFENGGRIENIEIAMGPGINQCHFEIREDVLDKFNDFSEFVIGRNGKMFADLKGIIRRQLHELGVDPKNIENNMECTMENEEKYFSFRRDKPAKVEAMVAVIGMK